MNNPFSAHSSVIVKKLFAMDRLVCRDWLDEIRGYLEQQAGHPVESLHEYLTVDGLSEPEIAARSATLSVVVQALNADDYSIFYASSPSSGEAVACPEHPVSIP